MNMNKYEGRFVGAANKGLRAKIRSVVHGAKCGPANEASVMALRRAVALTAAGIATLALVASDYRSVSSTRPTCDCDACVAYGLQYLGANG